METREIVGKEGSRVVRLGVMGIDGPNARAIVDAANISDSVMIVAVAGLEESEVDEFCEEEGLAVETKRFSSYDDLIEYQDVDAIYINLSTNLHKDWVLACAAAGKHILLEHPMATNVAEACFIAEACSQAQVALLETTAFLHHPRTKAIVQRIAEFRLVPNRIEVALAFPASDAFLNGLAQAGDQDPLGVAGDLGWFAARWGVLLFGAPAIAVSARRTGRDLLETRDHGTVLLQQQQEKETAPPAEMQAIVAFGNGRELHMHISYRLAFRQRLDVLAAHSKSLRCDDCLYPAPGADMPATYFLQTHANPPLQDLDHILLATTQEIQAPLQDQRICMLDAFAQLTHFESRFNPQKRQTHLDAAIHTQLIVNAILVSANNSGALVAATLPDKPLPSQPAHQDRPQPSLLNEANTATVTTSTKKTRKKTTPSSSSTKKRKER